MLNDDGLVWKSRFTNSLFLNLKLWPNDTEVSLHMTPMTDEPQQQHIAFEKNNAEDYGKLIKHRDGTSSIYIKDPSNNFVEILKEKK